MLLSLTLLSFYCCFIKFLPSRELTYCISHQSTFESMIFLFPTWDILVPWRVTPNTSSSLKTPQTTSLSYLLRSSSVSSTAHTACISGGQMGSVHNHHPTLPESNSEFTPQKIGRLTPQKETILFQPSISRC